MSRATIRRQFVAQDAVGGSAIITPTMRSGTHAHWSQEKKAVRHDTTAETYDKKTILRNNALQKLKLRGIRELSRPYDCRLFKYKALSGHMKRAAS